MRVLLIHPESNNHHIKPFADEFFLPYGVSLLGGMLKSIGHEVDILVVTEITPSEMIEETLTRFNPGIIGFSSVVNEYHLASKIAKYIKTLCPDVPLILGGPYSRTAPQNTLGGPWDYVCIDEGEQPVSALIEALENSRSTESIPGLWVRHDNGFRQNPPSPLITNLDTIPLMLRQEWKKWVAHPGLSHGILLSRGCPFSCSYCSNHVIRKRHTGDQYVRFRSPQNIIAELDQIIQSNPQTYTVYFETEALNNNASFVSEFCSQLRAFNQKSGINIPYKVNLAPFYNQDWNELFALLRGANIRGVNIGLESGSEEVRRTVLNRRYSNETIVKIAEAAKRHDVWLCFYVLIGLPGERRSDFQKTIDLCKKTSPDSVALSIYEPYPGTTLYDNAVRMGLLKDVNPEELGRLKASLDMPDFSRQEIQEEFELFNQKIDVHPLKAHMEFFHRAGINIDHLIPLYRDYYIKYATEAVLPVW
jgi:radical SAM superfamily enzyme YgiQ (UPF0313 family)